MLKNKGGNTMNNGKTDFLYLILIELQGIRIALERIAEKKK